MKKRLLAGFGVLAAIGAVWITAQNAQTSNSLSSLFPGGALVYVEARDLSTLLRDWNASEEKRLWLTSDNHEVFSRTRLFMRLAEAQEQFAETAGFAPDMSLVTSIAGAQSAIAIYDIGELEFLYVTRLPAARILNSTPFSQRNAYESRESAGIPYYVRSGANKRVAAFGSADGLLFLGTRGDLVANALALHAKRRGITPLAQDRWYNELTRAAASPGDIRIALNMPGLLKTSYFRSYWIQRNASQLKPFSAGVVDLFREPQQVREERLLLRESQSAAPSEQAVAQVTAWAPSDSGLYRAWADPETDEIVNVIRTKITNPGPTGDAPGRTAPSAANPDTVAGDSSDLETRIDQPPLQTQAHDAAAELRPVIEAANVQAMLQVQSSRTSGDGVFVGNDPAIALLAGSDWPAITLPDGVVHRQGRILVLATNAAMLQKIVAQIGAPPAANSASAYIAHHSHSRELAAFTRMMAQIDAGSIDVAGGGPRFFSQNVASLGRVLNRVDSATIVVRDDGRRVAQQMIYRLKP
jgi:hypothetical protein